MSEPVIKLQARKSRPIDLDATNSPMDGQVPVFDSSTGKFSWATVSGGGARYWSEVATEDWPRAEHCVPYDTSTTPMDSVALRWREGKYGSGVAFHSPSDDLPRGALGAVEVPDYNLRYVGLGVTAPSSSNPQMPSAIIIGHYYGGPQAGYSSFQVLGGGVSGTGPELLRIVNDYPNQKVYHTFKGVGSDILELIHDYPAGTVTLRFKLNPSGGYYLVPYADNTGEIGMGGVRWSKAWIREVITGDLKLKNERAEWTISEGEDGIYATNNRTGKRYRLAMEEVV